MKRIVFITGTRADYGKTKSLMKCVEASDSFELYIYVSGMHLLEQFGSTYREIVKDDYKNVYIAFGIVNSKIMSYDLGDAVCNLTGYVRNIRPDLIVVHGDRIDALAGAMVGALNNIKVAHIEGGELSGTIDESIRHAISKFSHIHLVCNEEACKRLIQLGENRERIYIIGSPDIDIMLSEQLPSLQECKERYTIGYDSYGILMYHPVTTEHHSIHRHIKEVVDAVIDSGMNYIVIYPNNDLGSDGIINEYYRIEGNPHFRVFPSIRFEYFLTLLKHADFMIGNSSAGIRETCAYGIPAIDIGTRQQGRYCVASAKNIQHTKENSKEIERAIKNREAYRIQSNHFGDGNSTERFIDILNSDEMWEFEIQKQFVDLSS